MEAQRIMINQLVVSMIGKNPTKKDLANAQLMFGLSGMDGQPISKQEYVQRLNSGTLVQTEEDLRNIHDNIKHINNPKTKNEVEQRYKNIVNDYVRGSQSESEYEYNPTDLEEGRGRYTDLEDERLHERLESIQRKLIMSGNEDLSSQNSGYITD